jgi:hypothetical protein
MRRAVAGAGLLFLLCLPAGCRQTASLSRQEVVVVFKADATPDDHARVWALCEHVDGADAEPLVTKSKYPATLRSNVRFRVDHASNYQLQQLFSCLKQDPSVTGYTTTGDT